MSLSILNNLASIGSQIQLKGWNQQLNQAINRLSTGMRINSASDDPSGLAMSERFRSQIKGLAQANTNAQNGYSMLQAADGGLNEVQSVLQRMRELSLQAANGTLTSQDRADIQTEIDQLRNEVDNIAGNTEFNTRKLLNGSQSGSWVTNSPDQLQAHITGQVREGNYRIIVKASATGTNQVLKSNIMALTDPKTYTIDTTNVHLTNTNGSIGDTANMTIDVHQSLSFNYKFEKGTAAEIIGSSGIGTVDISGPTQGVVFGAGSSQNTAYFSATGTVSFGGRDVTFTSGTYTQQEIECAIETATSGVISVGWLPNTQPAGGNFIRLTNNSGAITMVTTGAAGKALGLASAVLTTGGVNWGGANVGLAGSAILSMVASPIASASGIMYAGTQMAGVYKTTDGGATWSPANAGMAGSAVLSVATANNDSNIAYAGTKLGGVYVTTDGGVTWTAVNTGLTDLDVTSLTVDPNDSNVVYAGTKTGGVFKSTAGGTVWCAIDTGLTDLNIQTLATDQNNPTTVYAGTNAGGVFKSTDGGTTWTAVTTGLTDMNIRSMATAPDGSNSLIVGTDAGGVFRSDDGGATWSAMNTGLTDLKVLSLAFDPYDSGTIYAGTQNGGIFRTVDGGANWTSQNTGLTGYAQALVVQKNNPSNVFAAVVDPLGIGTGVFMSTNSITTGTENTERGQVYEFAGTQALSAATSMGFTINGVAVNFNVHKTNVSSATSTAAFGEFEVLDIINSALITAGAGVRAEIAPDHTLRLSVTSADRTVRPQSIVVSGLTATAAGWSWNDLGVSAIKTAGDGNNQLVFSVDGSSTYTAIMPNADYANTTADKVKLAGDLEKAMNDAVTQNGGSDKNLVNVVYDDQANQFHLMSRTLGFNSNIQLHDAVGESNILQTIGWDKNTHSQGNDDGTALVIYNGTDSTNPATNIYNRRGLAGNAGAWTVTGQSTISADRTLGGLGVQWGFGSAAAVTGNAGGLVIENHQAGETETIANSSTSLGMIRQFQNVVNQARQLNIYANGRVKAINFDQSTTLDELQNMIASAITTSQDQGGLGMSVNGSSTDTVYSHVADYISSTAEGTYNRGEGDAAVNGTLIIRSPWTGANGQISITGDDDVLNAFGFNKVRTGLDPANPDPYYIEVRDDHTNQTLYSIRTATPELTDVIPGMQVKLQPTVDTLTSWNDATGSFDFKADSNDKSLLLKVTDSHINMQIGAEGSNSLQTQIADVSSGALGIDRASVVDQNTAQAASDMFDKAITFISAQRAKLGAVMNRLEFTANNLTVQGQNTTDADSNIRDTDMAATVAQMTKYQMLMQSGTSVLAQANMVPQNLMTLLGK
ncbi:MAG: hypothetical protein HQK58_02400 [Deltaproteobacteria bacterium]|nr:hypothetical protein [Deltaproteobacteria bacterium]